MNRKRICAGAAAALLLLFSACEMMGPESGADAVPEGKAAVRIGIEGAGIPGRTAFPAVVLADVTSWKLLGGKTTKAQEPLKDFANPTGQTLYLETGAWDFTLEGFNNDDDVILRGNLTNQNITLEGSNSLVFTVSPVLDGNGTFKITINLPAGHSITEAKVFKDGTEIDTVAPVTNPIVFENTYAAGNYYFSFQLYKGGDLYGVVSEVAQVRKNLLSETAYTLGLEDLNISYVITYELNGGQFGGGVEDPGYYRSTDADFTLPTPTRTGYTFEGWYDNGGLTGSPVTQISTSGMEDKEFYAKWTVVYTVSGTISTDNPGGGVGGASVQLQQGSTAVGSPVSTGVSGAYTIPNVPAGTGYTIEVSLAGYATGTIPAFAVTTANVMGKNLTLVKLAAGSKISYTGDSVTFKTAWVPGGLTFPTGTGDNGSATVAAAYEIGETEVTYELWYAVRSWAEGNGYTFYDDPGREGTYNNGGPPTGASQEPVTSVRWFDAVVWLNALTEWVNEKEGKSLTPVYYYDSGHTTLAKDSDYSSNFVKEDNSYIYASAYAKPEATGFRLPSNEEWELAARWRGSNTVNVVNNATFYTAPWYTNGNSASGATADYYDAAATGDVAWYYDNITGIKKTQAVKGKTANALGLYDMSGNVREWCFDWASVNYRVIRGGAWVENASTLRIGHVWSVRPDNRTNNYGFRLARTP
jgi:uncharacterized repeat protein (TIGR02543 family)